MYIEQCTDKVRFMSITGKVRYIRVTNKVRYTRNTDFVYNEQKTLVPTGTLYASFTVFHNTSMLKSPNIHLSTATRRLTRVRAVSNHNISSGNERKLAATGPWAILKLAARNLYTHHPKDRIVYTTTFVTSAVEH